MSPLHNGDAFNSANPGRKCGMLFGGPPFQRTKSLYFLGLRRIFGLSRPGDICVQSRTCWGQSDADAGRGGAHIPICFWRPKPRSAGPDDLP
jgi:hypothetical protein